MDTQRRLENFCRREEIFRKIVFVYERAKFAGSPHCPIKNRFRLALPVAVTLIRKGGARVANSITANAVKMADNGSWI